MKKNLLLLLMLIGCFLTEATAQKTKSSTNQKKMTQTKTQPATINKDNFVWTSVKSPSGVTYKTVKGDPYKVRFYTLPNGLTFIASVKNASPRIQTFIATKAGSKNDPADNTGLAHYLEHMLFKGTDKYGTKDWTKEKPLLDKIDALYEQYHQTTDPAKRKAIYAEIDQTSGEAAKWAIANEYDKLMTIIGAKGTNAFTSVEQTVYVNDIPANEVDNWLKIEGERFRNPILRLFHTELEAVYEEKNISLDRDGNKVQDKLMEGLFTKHAYGTQTTIGTVEHLKNPSLKKIRDYYHKNYVPNNMAVIMVGDFDPDAAYAKVVKYMGYMQPKPVNPYKFEAEPVRTSPTEYTVFGPEQESVSFAFRLPGAGTKDARMLTMMDLLLSNSKSGLIDLNLTKLQKVQSGTSYSEIMKDYSVHYFEGQAKEGQSLSEVKNLLMDQIQKIKRGEFDESTMKAIVTNERFDKMRGNEENGSLAFNVLDAFVLGLDWSKKVNEPNDLTAITKAEIIAFANKYYNNDYVLVFKKKGEDKSVVKVDKPTITPVTVNRSDRSPFLTAIADAKVSDIQPVFLNYKSVIGTTLTKNNLPIYYLKNDENTRFSLTYIWEMGKLNDKKWPIALSLLSFLGTKDMTLDDINKKFYSLACSYSVNATDDQIRLTLTGLNDNFKEANELMENILKNAEPDQNQLNSLVDRILKSRENNKTEKRIILQQGLQSYAIYGKENPFNYIINSADLKQIKAEDLINNYVKKLINFKHRANYYGPLSEQELAKQIGDVHNNPMPMMEVPAPKEFARKDMTSNKVYFTNFPMVQAEILWVRKSENYNPAIAPTTSVFNEYFGGGMSGVVFQTIRESKALAYSTYSRYTNPTKKSDPHYVIAYIGTQADKFNDAVPAMNDLLNNVPYTEKSFADAKLAVRSGIESERIRKESILFNYDNAIKLGLTSDIRKSIFDQSNSLTWDGMMKFYDQEYKNKPFSYCIIGSNDKIKMEDLKKLGEVEEVTLSDIFGY